MAEVAPSDGPDSREDAEVPPLAFCVRCGRGDCAGCESEAPRVIPTTPWEERGAPSFSRLWQTARLTTVEGEAFFGALGDGNVGSALGFAVACELVAIASFVVLSGPVSYALAPGFVEGLFTDPEHRRITVALVVASVPALAFVMVALHVSWALGLEVGLRIAGTEGRTAHCVRYALYSCGWDLVTSPFGFGAGLVTRGFSGAKEELRAAVRIPRFATRAYLGRARRAEARAARRAVLVAVALTGGVVLAAASLLGIGLVLALV